MVVFPQTGCVPVPADVVVHSGFAYSAPLSSPEDVVYYVGLSNAVQDTSVQNEQGRYRVTGRVVAASQIDPRLEGTAILVLDRERVDDARDERPAALPSVNTTEYIREQVISNRSAWAATHPEANTLGDVATTVQEPTVTPSPTPAGQDGDTGQSGQQAQDTGQATDTPFVSDPSTPVGNDRSNGLVFTPGLGSNELVLLGVGFLIVVTTLSGSVLGASKLYHLAQGTDPPFSRRGYYTVWGLAGLGILALTTLANTLLGLILVGSIVLVGGWGALLKQLLSS